MFQLLQDRGAVANLRDEHHEVFSPALRHIEYYDDMMRGEVVWYRSDRGYGYLRDADAASTGVYGELYFDRNEELVGGPFSIEEGTPVAFKVNQVLELRLVPREVKDFISLYDSSTVFARSETR